MGGHVYSDPGGNKQTAAVSPSSPLRHSQPPRVLSAGQLGNRSGKCRQQCLATLLSRKRK
jgi:hypothetical protein